MPVLYTLDKPAIFELGRWDNSPAARAERFVTLTQHEIPLIEFYCQKQKLRATYRADGQLTVLPRYGWDGCTPKFQVPGTSIILGTWDGPIRDGEPLLKYPSLLHDVLYQFRLYKDANGRGLPFSRAQIDYIFYQHMKAKGFFLAEPYYAAVRSFGGVYQVLHGGNDV